MHGHLQSNENTRSRRFRQMNLTIHDKKGGMKRNRETSSFDISTFVPRISNYNKLDSLDIVSTRSKNSSFLEGHGNWIFFFLRSIVATICPENKTYQPPIFGHFTWLRQGSNGTRGVFIENWKSSPPLNLTMRSALNPLANAHLWIHARVSTLEVPRGV